MKRNLLGILVLTLLVSLGCAPGSAPTVTVTQTAVPTPTPAPLSTAATTPAPSPTPTPTLTTIPAFTTTPTPTATTSPASKTPPAPPSPPTQPTAPTITTSPAGQTTTSPSQPTQPSKTTTPTQPSAPAEAKRVEPDPTKGFNYAYYLYIPSTMKKNAYLLVLPNNTGYASDDQAVHEEAAKKQAEGEAARLAEGLGAPLLVPAFPRPAKYGDWMYTHALDRATLVTQVEDLKRLDLQLIAMIDDAIEKSSLKGVTLKTKVLMTGFSAAGMFANRFTILHPERVQAAAIGSPGGWPMVPVREWNGATLRYPVGVSDIKQIVGKEFDIQSFKSVPLYFYLGDKDTNQYIDENQQLISQFGATPVARWPVAEKMYQSVGCSSQFVLYPKVEHETTSEEWDDMITFFSNHLEPR